MARLIVILSVFVLTFNLEVGTAKAEYGRPFIYRPENYILEDEMNPKIDDNVIPSHYKLDLRLDENAFVTNSFEGIVVIDLEIRNATNSFQLHGAKLQFDDSGLSLTNQTYEANIAATEAGGLITITSEEELAAGSYSLTISYTGELSETDMAGFYKSTYIDEDGTVKSLATTQFESADAKRAFPCFDEPALKATFDISITYPATFSAFSNTAGTTEDPTGDGTTLTTTFQTTPVMSTYLVAFIVSEFTCTDEINAVGDGTPTRLCSRSELKNTRDLAAQTAPLALDIMSTYTGYNYIDSGIGKLTQFAIPDFAAGAMENWGLVTYREADVLWDPEESSTRYKQVVVTVVTHELSHQWFGDLVTLDWWNDIFLNEGFASYFEYHAADQLPESQENQWELTKQFVVEELQAALLTDSRSNVLPLSTDPDTPNEFDDISYDKAGSIFRMVHHILGLDNFIKGLTDYINSHTFSVGHPEHVWSALDQYRNDNEDAADLPDTLNVVMNSWTYKQGYPLLTVTLDESNLIITQEQFLIDGTTGNTTWYVPISYTTSIENDFTNTYARAWLQPDEPLVIPISLTDNDWIVLNNQQTGFYRVNYDKPLLDRITNALDESVSVIDELTRSQIVDDLFNLVRGNKITLPEALDAIAFLQNDDSYYTWYSAFYGFSYLLRRLNDGEVRNAFKGYIENAATAFFTHNSFAPVDGETHVDILRRVLALKWACNLNVEWCVSQSIDLFENVLSNTPINPDVRSAVYCTALQHSTSTSDDFDALFAKYLGSQLAAERVTILSALGCANDQAVRQSYLAKALDGEVRIQDVYYVFASVYSNNGAEGVTDVLNFVTTNWENITDYFQDGGSNVRSLIGTLASLITNQNQIDILSSFLLNDELDQSIKDSVERSILSAIKNLDETENLETILGQYLNIN